MSERPTILVTGGAGYVGAHACKALDRAGYQPVVLDNLVYGHQLAVRWGMFERGDIADRARLDELFVRYRPNAVMHFAAFAYVGESVTDPGKYYRNNVAGTLSLLEAMRDHAVHRLVFSSTCATYGVPEKVPIPESALQRPINPYGRSKLMVEMMLGDFDAAHSIRSIALRYFNAAGADPDGEIGELHDPESHLIPVALDAVTGRGPPLTVFGDDYDTPDGTCIRDYVHVSDLADAHVLALQALERGAASDAFNLGNGSGTSVREVLAAIERITGRPVPHSVGPRRPGDPAVLVSEARRSASELGWRPSLSDLDSIVATAWAWHRKAHG
jgi:UDP-arabinose 4-epimerase